MFDRIEKALTLPALVLAGLVMGSVSSTAFAAAPAHMASKDASVSTRLNGVHSYSPGRADTGIRSACPRVAAEVKGV